MLIYYDLGMQDNTAQHNTIGIEANKSNKMRVSKTEALLDRLHVKAKGNRCYLAVNKESGS